ncbi:MAG: transporter substrate-binding domain-containing protein [Pseudomonadota bacterium]|nr:transporter substrate-binding domain-containing protein [Pseudomonadota bacterium]
MGITSKSLGLVALLCAAACHQQPQSAATATAPQKAAAAEPCKLKVGWDPWEPYQYETADGQIAGLDVELARELADTAGCSLNFVQGNWADHLAAIKTGDIDLLLAATPNSQREPFAIFSEPYRDENMAMFVRSDKLEELGDQSLAELVAKGKRVAVTDGYFYGPEVAEMMTADDTAGAFVRSRIVEAGYARLVDGQVDVLLDDPVVAASVLRRKGWSDAVARHPGQVHDGQVALMFSRASVPQDLVQRFEKALELSRRSGRIESVVARYVDQDMSGKSDKKSLN